MGTYTIYVTPFGDQGLPNEIPLCTEDMSTSQCRSVTAIMIFRQVLILSFTYHDGQNL